MKSAWNAKLAIEVSRRELSVLRSAALQVALRRGHRTTERSSNWGMMAEAANMVEFQIDPYEQSELAGAANNPEIGNGLRITKGMAFVEPQAAAALMDFIANSTTVGKDVGAATSLVRKLASKLGQRMPTVQQGEKPGQASDPTPIEQGSAHPEVGQSRQPALPSRLGKVSQQDRAGSAGANQAGATNWNQGKTTVLDPSQQVKEPGMEDPERWFEDVVRIKDLLKTESSFYVVEENE
jgi:hypothetical protein